MAQISGFEPLEIKSGSGNKIIDLSVEVTSAADAFPTRRETMLPAFDGAVGRQSMLDE
jgi:hypothetical protein